MSKTTITFSDTAFNQCFTVIPNNADGNCLFESIETLLLGTDYELNNGPTSASKIREMVADFYKTFDRDIDYPNTTIEYNIKLGIMFDNIDDENGHDINIMNDYVWASMTDVLICSLLFEINIYLYTKKSTFDSYAHTTNVKYELSKINTQYNFKYTVHLLYNGTNHFESLLKK
jgi:hypothetical protein